METVDAFGLGFFTYLLIIAAIAFHRDYTNGRVPKARNPMPPPKRRKSK